MRLWCAQSADITAHCPGDEALLTIFRNASGTWQLIVNSDNANSVFDYQ